MKQFMKRIVRLVSAALVLTAVVVPARSFILTAGVSSALFDAVETARMHNPTIMLSGADYAISKIDNQIVKAFERAWQRSGNGATSLEGVVLILRMADGSFSGRDMGASNEYRRFTFAWHPAAIAIVHTHPNSADPKPCDEDIVVAEKHGVPIFTLTNRGMYVYDPGTRKVRKVMNDLDWLNRVSWSKGRLGKR